MNKAIYKNRLNQHRLNDDTDSADFVLLKRISTKIRAVPAALAMLIQCAALITVIAMASAVSFIASEYFHTTLSISLVTFVLMQAVTASVFSYLIGMASWWRWIHFSFPLAIWGMSNWQVPSEIYLAGFIISLSLFWTTFRSQVPFFPSRPIVWQQVANIIPQDKPIRLIDIGCGLGDMAMHIAKVRPESRIEGIEIAPLPWLISYVRGKIKHSTATFTMGDYRALNFANHDVIFAYLSPAAMVSLWQKASLEMLPGSLLISLEFEIPGITPTICIAGSNHSPTIYVWKMT